MRKFIKRAICTLCAAALMVQPMCFSSAEDDAPIDLGEAAVVYNVSGGDASLLTDGDVETKLSFSRKTIEDTWISVVVYDAGEGNTFDFNRIDVAGNQPVRFYGTNDRICGEYDLLDIAGTLPRGTDYSKDESFAEIYGLTDLGKVNNTFKSFDEMQSYRFFVAAISDGWAYNVEIGEISLSYKILYASLGEVVKAGAECAQKSGQWSATAYNAEYSVTDPELGIEEGGTEKLTVWGWIGGDDPDSTSGAGVVTYNLMSDREVYTDVKIVGVAKRDDRDFTVWVEGENGETSEGYTLTKDLGEIVGNLTCYTVKNIKVFEGLNKVKIGSSQFGYSPDFAMAVFVDKTDKFLKIGESYEAGSELELLCGGGEYNLLLSGGGAVNVNGEEYTPEALEGAAEDLYTYMVRGVSLTDDINLITVPEGSFKFIEQHENKITFDDKITVTAGGKSIASGESVPDGTKITVSAYFDEEHILDKLYANGKIVANGEYFVYNEDVEITAEFADVLYVTLTYDENVSVSVKGEVVPSGSRVRGDAILSLSAEGSDKVKKIFTANGEKIEGTTYGINKEDVHIGVIIIPYDLTYLENLIIEASEEKESGIIYNLPETGEYGAAITWTIKESDGSDTIEGNILTVDMTDIAEKTLKIAAGFEVDGKTYEVEKEIKAVSTIKQKLGGKLFYIRGISGTDASVSIDNEQFAVYGYGTDLWTAPDSFGYFYTKADDENYVIDVKVDLQQGNNQWRRSGLMIRQSDSENEKMVMLDVGAGNGAALEFAYRAGTTGSAAQVIRNFDYGSNIWLRLEKQGKKFFAYCSEDGENYSLLSSEASVTMMGEYCVGIFAESNFGATYFSRLSLNGSDVFAASDITDVSAEAADGKIKVTWKDPSEEDGRSFEKIIVTATDPDGVKTECEVAKGVGEAIIGNLTNGVMYEIAVCAKTAPLCQKNINGATAYEAKSGYVKVNALPFGEPEPEIKLTCKKKEVAVGQNNSVNIAFKEMQPIKKLELEIEIPDDVTASKNDAVLSDELKDAGATVYKEDGKLKVSLESEDVVYVTDILSISVSAKKAGEYDIEAYGTAVYSSFETGETEKKIGSKAVTFEAANKSTSGGGGSGSGSVGSKGSMVTDGVKEPVKVPEVIKTPEGSSIFDDKADIPAWAMTAVNYLSERGIISGMPKDEKLVFEPNGAVTREQFAKMCVEAFMEVDNTAVCSFEDVDKDAWYYPYVATMVKKGIISGYGNGYFGTGDNIKREDMAVIIYNLYLNDYIRIKKGTAQGFSDEAEIAPYAAEAVKALHEAGIVSGYENNRFAPRDVVSRAMAAKVIYGCMN